MSHKKSTHYLFLVKEENKKKKNISIYTCSKGKYFFFIN